MYSITSQSPPKKSMSELREARELSRSLNIHREANFILTQKDRPIPSLREMKEDLAKDPLTSIKERIATTKADHLSNLERLYAAHAADYLDDQRLQHESRDDHQGEGWSSKPELWDKRDPLSSTNEYISSLRRSVTIERERYAKVLSSLYLQKADIESRAEDERRRRDAAFPLTIEEFHAKPRDIQIRVATFFSSDEAKREKMRSEFGWAWRQTSGLTQEFERDIDFREQVLLLLEQVESKDPRKRQ